MVYMLKTGQGLNRH